MIVVSITGRQAEMKEEGLSGAVLKLQLFSGGIRKGTKYQ